MNTPSIPPSTTPRDGPAPRAAVGKTLLDGAIWTSVVTLVGRVAQTSLQIILAWLLLEEDFGVIGLAYTVSAYVFFLRHAGIGTILTQRARRFNRWSNAAAWMSMTSGLTAALILAAVSPVMAWFYQEPRLIGVLLVIALSMLPTSALTVPITRLRTQLRFRELALIQSSTIMLSAVLSVVMAFAGAGVYSFVVPQVVAPLLSLPWLWAITRPRVRWTPSLKLWKYLLSGSVWITAGGLIIQIINTGDYIILGRHLETAQVGVYYVAFMLSTQTMTLITLNLGTILLPTLAQFKNDHQKLTSVFLNFCGILALFGLPAGATLSMIAFPLVQLILPERWHASSELLVWLAVGMGFRLVAHNVNQMLQAQGRWRTYCWLNAVNAAVFLACCWIGVVVGGQLGVAIAVTLYFIGYGYWQITLAVPLGTPQRATRALIVYRDGAVLAAAGVALGLALTRPFEMPDIMVILIRCAAMAGVWVWGSKVLTPSARVRFLTQMSEALARRRKRQS